jgi:hypothetical protein
MQLLKLRNQMKLQIKKTKPNLSEQQLNFMCELIEINEGKTLTKHLNNITKQHLFESIK